MYPFLLKLSQPNFDADIQTYSSIRFPFPLSWRRRQAIQTPRRVRSLTFMRLLSRHLKLRHIQIWVKPNMLATMALRLGQPFT